ncbi:MAG: V-type ATP synthase subunit I [Limnochordia bacterium]|jgi:V/A-type H+-transporting ATPase subunit I
MAVAEMRRVTIVGHQSLLDQAITVLQRLEILHIDDIDESLPSEETVFSSRSASDADTLLRLEEQAARVRAALDVLDKHFRMPTGVIETFAGTRFAVSESEYRCWSETEEHTQPAVSQAQQLRERLWDLQARQRSASEAIEALRPWRALDVAVDEIEDTRLFRIQLGEVATKAIAEFGQDLAAVSEAAGFTVISEASDATCILLYYPKKLEEQVHIPLRRAEWRAAALPPVTGTVAQTIDMLEDQLHTIAAEQDEAIQAIGALVDERLALYAREDELRNSIEREQTKELLGYTQRLFVIRGWARLKDVDTLHSAMAEVSPAIVVEDEPPQPAEPHPVDIENPPVIRPFEVVTRVAGLPMPNSLDPTPYLAPFFFIFFGLALGDAGYGIVLSILSLWLAKRVNAVGLGLQLMYMMAICGIGAVAAGLLTGSWFGDLLGLDPLWINPMENPLPLLVLSVGLGVIQILAGLAIKGYDNIRKGRLVDAICDDFMWIVFLIGLVMMLVAGSLSQWPQVAVIARYLAIGGGAGLILTQGRHQKNPIKRLFSGILSLYGVSGYMSDALSYSRLLALGMSGGVIGMVINDMGRRLLPIPLVGWIVAIALLVVGHLLNLLINLISAYVHSSRLQYVEFFTKFLEAGGKAFRPLSERHRYLVVKPDAASSEK